MDNALSRVLTFSHNTMPAASLPLELQQEIFSYLDTRSFYAARKVCRWWRLAGFDSVTLARHLRRLPIQPAVDASETEPAELRGLFNEAARKLLLGVKVSEREEEGSGVAFKSTTGLFARPRIAAVSRGDRTVTINGGWLALFDTAQDPPEVLVQRPLNDMIAGARQIPWLQIAPAASYALALSSDGSLLAVAQERTIQIYDLSAGKDAETVSRTIASAAGHYVKALDFEQHDRVLRVQLSGKGVVLYLGTPAPSTSHPGGPANMSHWQSPTGLRHTFLDSSLLQLSQAASVQHYQARLGGLQLLRPFANGFLFAAQKHGGNASSHYIYGHVRCSAPADSLPCAVEPGSVTELATLESFLSAWDFVRDKVEEEGMGSWEAMPSAHEHHPKFSLSEDGGLLVLAEREKKHVRHVAWTQLFVYRVPALRRVDEALRAGEQRDQVRWKRLARFLEGQEQREGNADGEKGRPVVARVPLAVGSMEGEAREILFETDESAGRRVHEVTVVTEERRRRWELAET